VTLLSEAEYKEAGGTPAATQTPAQSQLLGNPEAVIKTSKGALTVELFEDAARNTVANFVTLVGDKFYDKLTKGEGKQKIFVVNDGSGKPLLAQTGSPTNELDPSSGPGYSIPSEVNTRKHSRGALAMVVAYDETNKLYIPDTSGSQFFICLQDVSYYDYLKSFTVFGQVTSGMEILDKLSRRRHDRVDRDHEEEDAPLQFPQSVEPVRKAGHFGRPRRTARPAPARLAGCSLFAARPRYQRRAKQRVKFSFIFE
jgi:cyclophilin family peptidyl-prolyl cis-trans isomerase